MEASSLTTFQLFLISAIVIGSAKLISIVYRQFTYWKKRKVPHVGTCPVFGSQWRVFLRNMTFPGYVKYLYNSYPNAKYVGTMDFATPTVVLRDPQLIKETTVKSFDHFPNHRSFITEEMDPIYGKNLFSLTGDRWKDMRTMLSPSFTTNRMKFLFDLVSKCSQDFVGYLYDHPESCAMLEAKDVFSRYTNDVIATAAFGISVNSLKDPDNEFYLKGMDATSFTGTIRLLKFMLFRLNARLTRMAGITFLSRATGKFFWKVIAETVNARKQRGIVRPDMIHLLMHTKGSNKSTWPEMTVDDIVAQAYIFFLAGFETVSSMICYLIHSLTVNQDVQQRLRKEVDCCWEEHNGEISYDTVSKMEYMEMVISESLRLYPPALVTDRVCSKHFELPPPAPGCEPVTVCPGDNIWVPIFAIHRDPVYFTDPEKFDPERFNQENKGNIDPYVYIPFGVGPRKCIANRFALMEAKILVIHLLRKFVIKPNEKTMNPIVFKTNSFTLGAKGGIWFTLEKRDT